jgi:predicted transcriptional regulator
MAKITASELASEIGCTPREVRKFLRSDAKARNAATPGKGARYAIEKREVRALVKRFATWDEARKADKVEESTESVESD